MEGIGNLCKYTFLTLGDCAASRNRQNSRMNFSNYPMKAARAFWRHSEGRHEPSRARAYKWVVHVELMKQVVIQQEARSFFFLQVEMIQPWYSTKQHISFFRSRLSAQFTPASLFIHLYKLCNAIINNYTAAGIC